MDKLRAMLEELSGLSSEADKLIGMIRNMMDMYSDQLGKYGSAAEVYVKVIAALQEMIRANDGLRELFQGLMQEFDMAEEMPSSFTGSSFDMPEAAAEETPEEQASVKNEDESIPVDMKLVEFSVVAPRTLAKGDYTIIDIIMYEEAYRYIVDEALRSRDEAAQEKRSGIVNAAAGSQIRVEIYSPDIEIEDNTETGIWRGKHLDFSFALFLPEDFAKKQILIFAKAYINDVLASNMKFDVKCTAGEEQKISVSRQDILSAFVSYASEDREHVAAAIQGMKKIRPELDVFFDVESLRSGDNWLQKIYEEIEKRDVLYLCWSRNAEKSHWVDAEWRHALETKGEASIEPLPVEPAEICPPPPKELNHKHFNDKLLYYAIKRDPDGSSSH